VLAISTFELGIRPTGAQKAPDQHDRARLPQSEPRCSQRREIILVTRRRHGQHDPGHRICGRRSGAAFCGLHDDVRGQQRLLILTQPRRFEHIHADSFASRRRYRRTNTFSRLRRAGRLRDVRPRLRAQHRRRAACRAAAERVERRGGKPRFVAGRIGTNNRNAAISLTCETGLSRRLLRDLRKLMARRSKACSKAMICCGRDHLRHAQRQAELYAICEMPGAWHRHGRMVSGNITDKSGGGAILWGTCRGVLEFGAARQNDHDGFKARLAPRICARHSPISAASPTLGRIPNDGFPTNSASRREPGIDGAVIGDFALATS